MRGDALKLTTQLAVVICVGIAGMVTIVVFLSRAGWSETGIAGIVASTLTAVGVLIPVVRNQVKQSEQIDQVQRQIGAGQRDQASTLNTVVKQTNGMATEERKQIAAEAAQEAAAQTIAALRQAGHI